jgi:hypothetical protein
VGTAAELQVRDHRAHAGHRDHDELSDHQVRREMARCRRRDFLAE